MPCSDHQQKSYLKWLEAESIHIIRESVAEFDKPVMLYSIGKDSSVLLHLARKAFAPRLPPFPLLHVDTTWKFRDMISFRDQMVKDSQMELIVHTNDAGIANGVTPFGLGSSRYTEIMKTDALKQALSKYGFDLAMAGARRDEEASRSKERIFSHRDSNHQWNPKRQRPELWGMCNNRLGVGESIRAFPLSNWTELDIWQYIEQENIDLVPLYFAAPRPVVDRNGVLLMVDDKRFQFEPGEKANNRLVRFRSLGCYPLTGAIESTATSVSEIITELRQASHSERSVRLIDGDASGSMEEKKRNGYF